MKKLLPALTGFFLLSFSSTAQVNLNEKCGTMPSLEYRVQQDPNLLERMKNRRPVLRSSGEYDTTGHVVIPVVFHVVYNPSNPEQNIDDSLLVSQIEVLNKDYSYTHAGIGTTLPIFDSLTAHTGIQFVLATQDPMGNPTNGITRTSSTTSHFLTALTNSVKADASGGKDPWPSDQYLNIWVCSMFPGLLGYATFPGDDPDLDGVVLAYAYVGERPGAPTAPNNLGRTATHECGHWLAMRHVWGDGGCGIDDEVEDTPDSDAASNQDCQLTRNDCDDAGNLFWHGTNPPDMVQNFMDYSADGCMTLFTRGQINRMWHHLVELRPGLFTSNGAGTPAINGYVVTQNITCGNSCDGTASVTVVEGTPPFRYLWDNAGADTTASVSDLCKGLYTVRVIDADNDTMYISSFVKQHTVLTGSAEATGASCSSCTDGSINAEGMGGNPAYTYALDGGTPQSSGTFTGLGTGSYVITITDSCGSAVNVTAVIDDVSSVSENELHSLLSVYPNPAQNEVTIQLEKQVAGGLSRVVLMDGLGQVVKTIETNGNQFVKLSLNDLGYGLYFLSVHTGSGVKTTHKLLVIK